MTQPIFRLVENTFYLEDNFESSEDYRATQLLLKLLAEEKGYTEEIIPLILNTHQTKSIIQ